MASADESPAQSYLRCLVSTPLLSLTELSRLGSALDLPVLISIRSFSVLTIVEGTPKDDREFTRR